MVCQGFRNRQDQGSNIHFHKNYICFVKVEEWFTFSFTFRTERGLCLRLPSAPPHPPNTHMLPLLVGLYVPVLLTFTLAPQGLLIWNSTQQRELFSVGAVGFPEACFVGSACCIRLLSLCMLHLRRVLLHYESAALPQHAGRLSDLNLCSKLNAYLEPIF